MSLWVTIVAMAVVTYATRVSALLLVRGEIAPWLQRWLTYVPIAVFTALIVPALVVQGRGSGETLVIGPALPAGVVGALVAWRGGGIVLTILAGLGTFWLLRHLGG